MAKLITASFVISKELKNSLEEWASQDNRSASYVLRDILKREYDRRMTQNEVQSFIKKSN